MPYAEIHDLICGRTTGCKNIEVARRVAKARVAQYNSTYLIGCRWHYPQGAYMLEDESKNVIYIKVYIKGGK